MQPIAEWLAQIGLERYAQAFADNDIVFVTHIVVFVVGRHRELASSTPSGIADNRSMVVIFERVLAKLCRNCWRNFCTDFDGLCLHASEIRF